ncbi:MAG TPA: DNA polymerase III subunit alpha [Syntrophorhabdales bacterium]|nr:DNA polymerase III subunit alpha [Syntrophorhabdales bacterium]
MKEFVHLHVHTQYSLLDGAIRFEPLFKTAKSYGMPACAITDHGNMFGAIDFYTSARDAGLKPIIGCEVYIAPKSRLDKKTARGEDNAYHLILLALDVTGYRNLVKMVSHAHLEGFYYVPRIDQELLVAHNEGLLCLTACIKGRIPQMILRDDQKALASAVDDYLSIFGDRLYFEVQDNGIPEQKKVNEGLIELSKKYNVPLVATNDCHYLKREEAKAHELLLCIQTGKTLSDKDRLSFSSDHFYFKSGDEMDRSFSQYPEVLTNTLRIAEMCNVKMESGTYHFPEFKLPSNESLAEHFENLCRQGFEKKISYIATTYPAFTEDLATRYQERLNYELKVIKETGFAGYFLIVSDFIGFAKSQDIPVGPGRGSAAGSLVAYCLGITNIDPIKYDLIFERFLNPERISMPDIDVDFCIEGRERVIQYVTERYGKENVAQIITFGTMKSRAAVRDVGRALGFPYADVDRIAKLIPAALDMSIEQALHDEPRLKEMCEKDPSVAELIDNAMVLEGLARHASTHAAGIVISNKPLVEHLPLHRGTKGETVTQYPMKSIEKIGLIKFDLLGLKTLTIIDNVIKTLKSQGISLDIANLPLDDPGTYELLSSGNTSGIFQLESRGMRDLLIKLKPSKFEDIIALIALYRPGPLTSGMMEQFIKRKNNPALIKYETELLEEVLKDTYGVIVYQEQIMKIASRLAGFSQSEADALRKAISKKVPEQLESYREQFVHGSAGNGVKPDIAARIYDVILQFGQYGFNKSHSAAYALVAYQTAYLKTHHYLPFMAAILTNEVNDTDSLIRYVAECRESGATILPPDVNESDKAFTIVDNKIRFGLSGVKNVGDAALDSILHVRRESGPFTSLLHFCSLVDSRKVNKKVVESLIKAGSFDSMGLNRAHLYAMVRDRWDKLQKKNGSNLLQMDMFGSSASALEPDEPMSTGEELPHEEILRGEKEALGFYFSQHPLATLSAEISRITPYDTASIKESDLLDDVTIVGIVNGYREITTKRGDRMASIMLEDTKGIVEAIVFPDLLSKHILLLKGDEPLVISGSVERLEDGTTKIRAKQIAPLKDNLAEMRKTVKVVINCQVFKKQELKKLKDVLHSIRGDSKVVLEFYLGSESKPLSLAEMRIDASKLDIVTKQFSQGVAVEVLG